MRVLAVIKEPVSIASHLGGFARDWRERLSPAQIERLAPACLLRGQAAAACAAHYADIIVSPQAARAVFVERSLPRCETATARAFGPGWYRLPQLASDALVSLVYNRGDSLVGPRRTEMRAIRAACDQLAATAPTPRTGDAGCE